jgi:hypothetical protein
LINPIFEKIAEQILSQSIAIKDDVLDSCVLDALAQEALTEYSQGEFKDAKIGKGIAKQRISEVRGDKVFWLNKVDASARLKTYWNWVEGLQDYLYRVTFCSLSNRCVLFATCGSI